MSGKEPGKKGNVGQGILVLLILLIGAGGAGFGVGYTQKFVPIEMVAPDTGAATSSTTATTPGGSENTASQTPSKLKKAYWISTKGWDRAGYSIKVSINDQPAGTFATIDRMEDITRLVKVGDNKVRFEAKALPAGNRNDYTGAHFTVSINQGEKFSTKGYKNAETLVEYKRKVTETDNFDDTMDFAVVE